LKEDSGETNKKGGKISLLHEMRRDPAAYSGGSLYGWQPDSTK
jgi:hypothetical protein